MIMTSLSGAMAIKTPDIENTDRQRFFKVQDGIHQNGGIGVCQMIKKRQKSW